MTSEEVLEHAKAIKDFCNETDCEKCPFSKESEIVEDRIYCKLSDYSEPPCGWELEEEE